MLLGPSVPGETPIDDLSGPKLPGIKLRSELNVAELENIRKALVKYFGGKTTKRLAPFDLVWCLRLHAEMLGDVWDWAGQLRTSDGFNIGIPCHKISSELQALLDDLVSWPGFGMPWTEQAARLHHRAVFIHPFVNGNGRWARFLANIWLKKHRQAITLWPEAVIGEASSVRGEYLSAIVAADRGDYGPLTLLHATHSEQSS
jgi:Fic-DOC domain mobile mystery protein B